MLNKLNMYQMKTSNSGMEMDLVSNQGILIQKFKRTRNF